MSKKTHAPAVSRPHKVYQPGKRHMELIASVSRSSGLEKDGDALRDFKVQQEYREFIQSKLDEYWKRFPYGQVGGDAKLRQELQGNLLILFRKLREGLLSTKRSDSFALEVYETSLYLSIIFNSPMQTTSILSHLLPSLYTKSPQLPSSAYSSALISLVHHLVSSYPSQSRFHEHLASLPLSFLPKDSPQRRWLTDLTRTLRNRNYARLEDITSATSMQNFIPTAAKPQSRITSPTLHGPVSEQTESRSVAAKVDSSSSLPFDALCTLVNALRVKAQESNWLVIRSAYRELHCPRAKSSQTETPSMPSPTSLWLCRSLTLKPVVSSSEGDDANVEKWVQQWLDGKCEVGEVRPKEGAEGRWIVCKVRL